MVRIGAIVLGIGLTALWALGLWADRSALILWFDAVLALLSFGVAGLEREDEMGATRGGGPALVALGLTAVVIGSMASGQPAWVSAANFVFACAYLVLAIVAASRGRHVYARARSPRRRGGRWLV